MTGTTGTGTARKPEPSDACRTWADHQWGGRRFVEAGRHPLNGRFYRYMTECLACGRQVRETHWIDTPGRA